MLQLQITVLLALLTVSFAFLLHRKRTCASCQIQWASHFATAARLSRRTKYQATRLYDRADSDEESLSSLSWKLFSDIMENQTDEMSLLNSRMRNLNLNRTYLGQSTMTGGGRGLFANCDCREGDLLTCYPGDALVFADGDNEEDWKIQWADHVDVMYRSNELHEDQRGYVVQATDDVGIFGHSQLDKDSAYLGHFCNDGATSIPTSTEELASYVLESQDGANASHEGLCNDSHMVTVAIKPIRKGQEVFVSYGPDYWIEHNQFGS